jgi:hypothetical protein
MKTKILMVLALSMSFQAAYAQNEEQVLNSAPINVDGYLAEDRPVTDGELEQIKGEIRKQKTETQLNKEKTKGFKELTKQTEKLSETTEAYLDEKKDAQKEIAEYNAKIKCLMEENPGRDCDKYVRNRKEEVVEQPVTTAQAAPAVQAVSATDVEAFAADGAFEQIKLLPYAGATTYSGKVESLEAELAAGLRLESNITTRFSMGVGFNYAQLKTQDFANGQFGNGGFNGAYGAGYRGQYSQQGREIQFNSMGIDLYGKFFITQGARFRPYIGAALGMNRASMKYSENNPYQYNQYNFGNEELKQTYAVGQLMLGSEIMITKSFGINIEGSYATGLGDSMSSSASQNMANSPDQARLRELGKEIINANVLSIFAGAVVVF